MNNKKFFGAALTSIFSFVLAVTVANFSSTSVEKVSALGEDESAAYSADSFHSVALGRDEMTVDIQSLTSTSTSKSATITFTSVGITGWGTPKKNAYIVIDDPDYSGSESQPSLSGKTDPQFSGYTIEMSNIATFTLDYTPSGGERVKRPEFVIPQTVSYGTTFSIKNERILTDSFIFEKDEEAAFERLIIPNGITEIESKAFQNVPEDLDIMICESKKPDGWASDWCDAKTEKIHWGYELIGKETTGRNTGNETNQLDQSIGTAKKSFGKLSNSAGNADSTVYSVIDDVNWTGDFDNPVRSTYGINPPYELDGYVFKLYDKVASVYVPETMKYGDGLFVSNKRIASKAMEFEYDDDGNYIGTLTEIHIPVGIEEIESRAFASVPSSVTIKCEAASKPALWSDSWVDKNANVSWGVAFPSENKQANVTSTDKLFRLPSEDTTYILGYKYTRQDKYYCTECGETYTVDQLVDGKCPKGHHVTLLPDVTPEMQKPLVVNYKIRNTLTNSEREVWYEFPLQSEEPTSTSTSYYDSVRTQPLSRSFDILLEDHEEFMADSVVCYNVFRAKATKILTRTVEDGQIVEKYLTYRYPDTSVCFSSQASKRYKSEVNINSVIKHKFSGLTKFFDYSMITMSVDKVLPSYWLQGINPDVKSSVQDKLDDGSYSIRYAVYNINNSFYRLTYYSPSLHKDVTVTTPIKTPNSVVVLEKNTDNKLSYLIKNADITYEEGGRKYKDFKLENLKQFEIVGFTINIHLWNNAQSTKVGRTDLSIHFGAIDVMPATANKSIYDIFLFVLIFELIALVVYAIGSFALFFYLREKFKNDEFRRMKPKSYVKTAILGYLGLLIISITILFIIFRGGLFDNAVAAHNPIDVFIVIPGVISIVIIGYFIKFVVGKIKANKQRKQANKLKLNEDVADDGTK